MFTMINVVHENNIATITLNRPDAMNAFHPIMGDELLDAFRRANDDKNIRVIHLNAVGKVFCVGGDIRFFAENKEKMADHAAGAIDVLNELIITMRRSPKPILTSVQGAVAGVGLSFALASDFVIAHESTQFNLAYAGIGLTPDGGASYFLPRIVGMHRATQLMMLPDMMSAEQALNETIINTIAKAEDFNNIVTQYLTRFSLGPTIVYAESKKLLNDEVSLVTHLANEKAAFLRCIKTNDYQTGIDAFLNRKRPQFSGN